VTTEGSGLLKGLYLGSGKSLSLRNYSLKAVGALSASLAKSATIPLIGASLTRVSGSEKLQADGQTGLVYASDKEVSASFPVSLSGVDPKSLNVWIETPEGRYQAPMTIINRKGEAPGEVLVTVLLPPSKEASILLLPSQKSS
jgi:hypothetical protein